MPFRHHVTRQAHAVFPGCWHTLTFQDKNQHLPLALCTMQLVVEQVLSHLSSAVTVQTRALVGTGLQASSLVVLTDSNTTTDQPKQKNSSTTSAAADAVASAAAAVANGDDAALTTAAFAPKPSPRPRPAPRPRPQLAQASTRPRPRPVSKRSPPPNPKRRPPVAAAAIPAGARTSFTPPTVAPAAFHGQYKPPTGFSKAPGALPAGCPGSSSVLKFGATGNGAASDVKALLAADRSGAPFLFFPAGTYRITSNLKLTKRVVMGALLPAGLLCSLPCLACCEAQVLGHLSSATEVRFLGALGRCVQACGPSSSWMQVSC
jgi:hypothetical protein